MCFSEIGTIFFSELAVCFLQKYEQNLEIAVNIFLENSSSYTESTVSSSSCMAMDVDEAQGIDDVQGPVIKISPHICSMESDLEGSNCGKLRYRKSTCFSAVYFG